MLGSINTPMNKGVSTVVYVIQELPGTRMGAPKFNIMGASRYGKIVTLLPENSQIILSPGPLVFKLRKWWQHYKATDYLLLTWDPAIIGEASSIVSDLTNGRFNLLKWYRQEKMYYPREIKLYEKGEIEENSWHRILDYYITTYERRTKW